MSILEEEESNIDELRKCKISYLKSENQWMQQEYDFLCTLIQDYKKIIEINQSSTDESEKSRQVETIQEQINNSLLQKLESYELVKEKTQETKEEFTLEEFVPMIESFEEKIQKLQADIKDREAKLQSIQDSKDQGNLSNQKKVELKCLNSYDIHSKMLERIRREVLLLRNKKKQLENKLAAAKQGAEDESTIGSSESKAQEQSFPIADNQMSAFEKVVLLLKKKRYHNDCLEERIRSIKNKIAEKKEIGLKIKRQCDNLEWKCIDNLQYGANGFVDSHCDSDLSIAGRSMAQNASFSFDVSRFIKPHPRRSD